MKDKILAIIAATLFTVYFAAQCILLVDDSNQLIIEIAHYASVFFQVISGGLLLLQFSGSARSTILRRIANFGIAALLIGILFTLQRWPGSYIFMNVGVYTCLLTYVFHLTKKRKKRLNDALKLLLIPFACFATMSAMYHILVFDFIEMACNLILAIALAIQMKELWSAKPVYNDMRSAIFDK